VTGCGVKKGRYEDFSIKDKSQGGGEMPMPFLNREGREGGGPARRKTFSSKKGGRIDGKNHDDESRLSISGTRLSLTKDHDQETTRGRGGLKPRSSPSLKNKVSGEMSGPACARGDRAGAVTV